MSIKKKCLDCGEPFDGRIDKLYCSPYCKSSFHYKKNQDKEESLYSKIDKQLKLNRRLLKHFNRSGKSTIIAEKLIEAGFNPNYFTHYWKNRTGKVYLFCYDVGFLKVKESTRDKFLLIDWQAYMQNKKHIA